MAKGKITLAHIGIALILILAVVGIAYFGLNKQLAAWGGTFISLTGVTIQSTSQFWNELNMQGYVVLNGQGQQAVGEVVTGGVQTLLTGTNYKSTQDLKIDVNMDFQLIRYATALRQTRLYTTKLTLDPSKHVQYSCNYIGRDHVASECVSQNQFSGVPLGECSISNAGHTTEPYDAACKQIGGVPVSCNTGESGSRQCLFITTTERAKVYNLNTPTKEWQTTFKMTTGGKTESVVVSDTTLTNKGTNLAVVSTGLAATNEQPPAENTAMLTITPAFSQTLVNYADETYTKSLVKTNYEWQSYSSPTDGTARPYQEVASEANRLNNQVETVMSTSPPAIWSQSARPVTVSTTSIIMYASSKPYYYPTYTFFTKASWLGIYVPISKPVAVTLNIPSSVQSGQYASITASIRNDGSTGTIDAILTCNSPIQITSGSTFRLSGMAQGESRTAYYTITTNVASASQGTCSLVAKDAQDPSITSATLTGTTNLIPIPSAQCGNGICEPPTESTATCSQDCKGGTTYCADGTVAGQCSKTKPLFCSTAGYLVPQASACGCTTGLVAQPDGTCGSPVTPPPQTDWTLIALVGTGILALIVGVYALASQKKRR